MPRRTYYLEEGTLIWRCWLQRSLRPLWHRRRTVLGILRCDMLLAVDGIIVWADFGQQLALLMHDHLEVGLLRHVGARLPVGAIGAISGIHSSR